MSNRKLIEDLKEITTELENDIITEDEAIRRIHLISTFYKSVEEFEKKEGIKGIISD